VGQRQPSPVGQLKTRSVNQQADGSGEKDSPSAIRSLKAEKRRPPAKQHLPEIADGDSKIDRLRRKKKEDD
jgi:hypothetical protein